MNKKLLILLLLLSSTALAQDISNHALPIGGGPGAVGWKTGGPCTAGQTLVWVSGVTADPSCASIAAGGLVVGTSSISGGVSGNFFYNNAGVLGERTPTQATAALNLFSSTLQGLVPSSGGSANNFLNGSGTWTTVANAGLANSSITLNAGASVGLTTPGAVALGATGVIGAITDVPRFAGINVPIVRPNADSTTAVQITNAGNTNQIVRVDTTNNRVGVNKTPGAFDLDVNGALNVGTTLTFTTLSPASLSLSTSTITGLTVNNSPIGASDYLLYFSSANNQIQRCTVTACSSTGVSGVSSLNSLTGGLSLLAGTGLSVTTSSPNITYALSAARQTLPNVQVFNSGTNLTYTTPANTLWIRVKVWGAGGGGSGGDVSHGAGSGTAGTSSCVNTGSPACTTPLVSSGGGLGGNAVTGTGGTGGTVGGSVTCSEIGTTGSSGGAAVVSPQATWTGGIGGDSPYLNGGGKANLGAGESAIANTGSGGQGGGISATGLTTGPGGGSGAYCEHIITTPAGSYIYTVAGSSGGGVAGANGFAGGNGANGKIIFEAHFGS